MSPATYNQIVSDNVLTLPSVRHLRRLTSALDVTLELSVSTIAYLEARLSKLMPKDLYVNVIMDEMYCQQNVQYYKNFAGCDDKIGSWEISGCSMHVTNPYNLNSENYGRWPSI